MPESPQISTSILKYDDAQIEVDKNQQSNQPVVYQIKIEGYLGHQWKDWFEGLTITLEEDGNTLLTGPVIDQAALHGLIKKVVI